MAESLRAFRELRAYKAAFELQQRIFKVTKSWPFEERYALIDQVWRSARSIGANIFEAWAKRKYPGTSRANFLMPMVDFPGGRHYV